MTAHLRLGGSYCQRASVDAVGVLGQSASGSSSGESRRAGIHPNADATKAAHPATCPLDAVRFPRSVDFLHHYRQSAQEDRLAHRLQCT